MPDPNSEVSPGVMKTEKGEKKEGIIGLFSKKKKKEKKSDKVAAKNKDLVQDKNQGKE